MSRAVTRLTLAILAVVLAACIQVHAQDQAYPPLTGRVVDAAGVLGPRVEDALTLRLADWEAESSDQIVVATVPDLGGQEIARYAVGLGRAWGIGVGEDADGGRLDNGAILLVAPSERQVHIAVGYGLEGTLTDAASSVIIQTRILPAFREGDYEAGVTEGVIGMIDVLSGAPAEAARRRERAPHRPMARGEGGLPWPLIVFLLLALFASMRTGRRGRRGGRRVRYDSDPIGGALPWIVASQMGRGGFGGARGGLGRGLGGGTGGGFGGGFSGGGGSFGGGGASGSW